jgi:Transposase DDE domain
MLKPQYTVTPKDVQAHAAHLCQRHLRLQGHGPKTTAATLLALLCYAAARITSLGAACKALLHAPGYQATHDALLATLPKISELLRRLNRALQGDLPRALRRRRQPLAIDLHLVPYHGSPLHDEDEVYRGPAKSGTSHFHAYATAYVIRKGQRFTVALAYVRKGQPLKEVIRELLRQAARAGVRPRYLLLDRGFWGVGVIRYLLAARYPFLMAVPCKGRKADHPKGPGGTRVFHLAKRSGWGRYTLQDKDKHKATVSICVKCRNRRGERGKHGREALVYAYGGGLKPSSYQWVKETYRSRFAIETSYRQLQQARIRTSTREPLLRLLYVGVALILRNVWVWLHWEVLAHRRRGGRRLDLDQLPFRAMLLWLQHLAEEVLGVCDQVTAERPIRI